MVEIASTPSPCVGGRGVSHPPPRGTPPAARFEQGLSKMPAASHRALGKTGEMPMGGTYYSTRRTHSSCCLPCATLGRLQGSLPYHGSAFSDREGRNGKRGRAVKKVFRLASRETSVGIWQSVASQERFDRQEARRAEACDSGYHAIYQVETKNAAVCGQQSVRNKKGGRRQPAPTKRSSAGLRFEAKGFENADRSHSRMNATNCICDFPSRWMRGSIIQVPRNCGIGFQIATKTRSSSCKGKGPGAIVFRLPFRSW